MPIYSHSRLSTFEQCTLKFKFAYIDKIKSDKEGVEAFLGSRVHEVFEKLYNDLKFQKKNSLQELLDHFNEIWKEKWHDDVVIVKEEYDQDNYRQMGEKFITDYYNRYQPFDQETLIAIEQRVVIDIDGYQIQGYIDRLGSRDGTYYIHDYKTGNTLMTQEYADKDRQLALYAIAVKERYKDCKRVKLVWHYLAFDKEIVSERTDEELEDLKKEIKLLIVHVESHTEFVPNRGALCNWCQYQEICPEFKHLYETQKLEENEFLNEDGVSLVNTYAVLSQDIKEHEKKLEKVREALIAYAKKEEVSTVYGSDDKVSIRSYEKMSFPKKEDPNRDGFFETVKQLGLWEQLAIVDVYELTKMINRKELHEDFVKLLDTFITKNKVHFVRVGKK